MGWYLTITEDMRTAGLAGNALLVFALVHGYSQQQQGCYYGSLAHTAEVVGCTGETARTTLRKLTEDGFIERFEFIDNGIRRVAYRTTQKIWDTQKICADHPKNLGDTPQKIWDNNNSINNTDKKSNNIDFDFRTELLRIGVTAEVADAWIDIRRKKKCSFSRIAFKELCTELGKVEGMTNDECIRKAVARNWAGFEASWLQPKTQPRVNAQPRRQESVYEHNARVWAEMFGPKPDEQ